MVMLRRTRIDVPGIPDIAEGRRSAGKRLYLAIALMLVLVCAGYWLKCHLGINFSDSVSVSSYFPFNYLDNDVLWVKKPGIVIDEDFDHPRIFSQWSDSVFHRNYKATSQLTEDGFGDHSRCLQITSDGNHHWAYPFSKFIAVPIALS